MATLPGVVVSGRFARGSAMIKLLESANSNTRHRIPENYAIRGSEQPNFRAMYLSIMVATAGYAALKGACPNGRRND